VLHKPPGLVVHPGVGNPRGTLVNGLVHYFGFNSDLPSLAGNPENRPGLVHRIDKDTSGLMVIAKTEFAMSHLAKQFFDHSIHRRYQAIVWSQPNEEQGEFEAYIGRNPKNHRLQTVFLEEEAGKWSKTHWRLIEGLYYVSLMEFELETGRTHQIRVHAKHLGHPVFSDTSYGGDSIRKGTVYNKYKQFVQNCFKICSRQALHAKELGFVHPTTGEQMMFKSELPAEMTEVLEKWRSYVGTKNS
jgi:23S rRNA pseudouridine1911/1915/1917 synthase